MNMIVFFMVIGQVWVVSLMENGLFSAAVTIAGGFILARCGSLDNPLAQKESG